ncbi:MAG: DUF624 domain-containing protein [Mogibacterium sp.]|nr:DUF624 domain-containing protein [Mogibacterium sp.]
MDKFFDSNNPVMRFLSRLVDLVILNLFTVLYSLPIITLGGALTAMNYVLLHLVRKDETYVIQMFRKSFKQNFRQGIPEGLIVLAAAGITAVDLLALRGSESRTATLLMIVITIIAVMIFTTCVYMFALQSRYENTVKGTMLNAVRLAIGNFPRSVLMAASWLVWILVLVYLHRAALAFFLLYGFTLPGFLCALLYNKILEKLETKAEPLSE